MIAVVEYLRLLRFVLLNDASSLSSCPVVLFWNWFYECNSCYTFQDIVPLLHGFFARGLDRTCPASAGKLSSLEWCGGNSFAYCALFDWCCGCVVLMFGCSQQAGNGEVTGLAAHTLPWQCRGVLF